MIDQAMILKLAEAARIELAQEELARLAAQLSDILEQIAPLADVPAGESGAVAAGTIDADVQALRADEPGADRIHGTLGRFAPEIREGFFTVPLIRRTRGGN